MTTNKTYQERLQEWQARNPLRQWRDALGIGRFKAAPILRVGATSIQKWEGGTMPTIESLMRLAEAMDTDWQTLKAQWEQWLAERPKPEKGGTP